MRKSDKTGVKEKIKIFESKYFTTYRYIFKNGNSYLESVPKWKQKDFSDNIKKSEEEKLETKLDKLVYRR